MTKKNSTLKAFFVVVFGLLTVGTVLLQVYKSGANTTKVETTLFGILQFVFSIVFAWLIATTTSEREFVQSQKQFAIAAFRRIKEIEKGVQRLLLRVSEKQERVSGDILQELNVIREISIGINETIKSSIADWADIIGEELQTIQKIEEIQESREPTPSDVVPIEFEKRSSIEGDKEIIKELRVTQDSISELISSLPSSLQAIAKPNVERWERIEEQVQLLRIEKREEGFIMLNGFYESGFERDIFEFSEGDTLFVGLGDAPEKRLVALVVKDADNKSVGIITNHLPLSYDEGIRAIIECVGKSNFQIQITDIDRTTPDERHYFQAKTVD